MVSFIPYPNLHTNRYVFYSNLSIYVFSRISRDIADAVLKKLYNEYLKPFASQKILKNKINQTK